VLEYVLLLTSGSKLFSVNFSKSKTRGRRETGSRARLKDATAPRLAASSSAANRNWPNTRSARRSAAATATASRSLPRGPLFPQYRKNKYNRRNGSASKQNSEFVRGLGITDRRKAPMHSWRHYFKTVARGLIEEPISDAISGHGSESEGRQYGVYELRLMAAEIAKLPNPLAE
jgi:hypothetical protein